MGFNALNHPFKNLIYRLIKVVQYEKQNQPTKN